MTRTRSAFRDLRRSVYLGARLVEGQRSLSLFTWFRTVFPQPILVPTRWAVFTPADKHVGRTQFEWTCGADGACGAPGRVRRYWGPPAVCPLGVLHGRAHR